MIGEGPAQIGALIGAVHERFPGFRFALLGTPDGHGDHGRFSGRSGRRVPRRRSRAAMWSRCKAAAFAG